MEMTKELWSKISVKTKVIAAICILVLTSLVYKWYSPVPTPAGTVSIAPPAKVVASVDKEEVTVTKAIVYDKKQVVKKVHLPQDVVDDPDDEVTSVSDVAPSKAGSTVTTVFDKSTGETKVYQEPKKMPLFGFGGEAKVGLGYGVYSKGIEKNLHGEYQFIRVGNVYGSVRGEVNDRGEVRGTVNADYQW